MEKTEVGSESFSSKTESGGETREARQTKPTMAENRG
jgi:hypothetical protein